jgi:deoxyribonuclease V
MQIPHLHDWNVTPQEAIALQNKLVSQVIYDRSLDINKVKLVAGVDVSVKENTSQAAIVVLSYPDLNVVEAVQSQAATPFPYIPGLLAFREGPVLENAFKQLQLEPDVFIFDGMGRAHPRRMGIATHMGLWLQRPTIGCGKTFLLGTFTEPDNERGAYSELKHKGEIIGVVLRTRANVKPVFISPGHLIDLQSSIALVMNCTTKYRLPDPIRMAHQTAGKFEK